MFSFRNLFKRPLLVRFMGLNDIAARHAGIVCSQDEIDDLQRTLNARASGVASDVTAHFGRFVQDTLMPLLPPGCSVADAHRATYDASSRKYVIQMGPVTFSEGPDATRVLPTDALQKAVNRYGSRCSWVSYIQPSF